MKAALCLASLAILAGVITAAPYAWDPDTLYTYRVQSRFAAGLLGLDGPNVDDTETDRALVELTWNVDVYRTQQSNTIFMNPREFRAVVAKEQIHPREDPISSQKETAIPQKYQDLLEKVMIVKLDPKSGVPESIVVRADQPLSITEKNIKRAQVQAFILNPGTSKLVVKGNTQRSTNSVRQSEQDDESGHFYKVMEESIHGECQTYYQVSQTGPFQSLYQNEAQDVPAQDNQQDSSSESNEQQRNRNPRFAGAQQQHMQQQQQQWKTQQKQQWQTQHQQQQWQTQHQQQQWQTRQHQNQNENEVNQDAQQQPWPQAFQQYCDENDQVYVIQKTVNLTACRDRPVLASMMPSEFLNCRPGDNNCGSLWNHVVSTRFLACGQNRRDFTIIEVNQEERFVYGLRTDENIDGYAVKNVTLQQKERTSSNPAAAEMKTQGQQEYEINSLVFEFDLNEQQKQLGGQPQQQWQQHQQQQQWQQQSSSSHRRNQQQQQSDSDSSEENVPQGTNGPIRFPLRNQKPTLEQPPLRPQLITNVASQTQLQQRILELIQDATENIHNYKKSIAEGETLSLLSVAAKAMRYMSKQQLLETCEKARQNNQHSDKLEVTAAQFCHDALSNAGTNPALVALMELIEGEHITFPRAIPHIMTFVQARHPTTEFMERYQQFINSSAVQNEERLRTPAILAHSALLHKAFVNANKKQSSYSYAIYGPWGQLEDTEQYVDQHIKALGKALKKSDKEFKNQGQGRSRSHEISLRLAALGNIGHPKTTKIVQQILDESNDLQTEKSAIYALKNLIQSQEENNPVQHRNGNVNTEQNQNEVDRVESDPITNHFVENKVLPILVSVALDNSKHPEVRMASISLLFHCTNADVAVWQKLAMSTWPETSLEVHNYIYSTITSLAELEDAPTPLYWRMIVNARSVRPILKPLNSQNAGRSTNSFASGSAPYTNTDFIRQTSWTSSQASSGPTGFYYRSLFVFGDEAVGVNPIEVALNLPSLPQVVENIRNSYRSSSSEVTGEKNQFMKNILDNITTRKMEDNQDGSLYLNIREMQTLLQISDLKKYLQIKNVPFEALLRHGVTLNYQKNVQLAYQSMEFPTILGLPMSFKLRVPAMVSFRGKAKLNGGPVGSQFHAQVDAVVAKKRTIKVSLKVPFLKIKVESGMQSHFVGQLPFRMTARHRSDQPVIVAFTPTANINGTAAGKIELATFHRQPYVAIITDELYPAVHSKGGQMTVVRTLEAPTTNENQQNILGFSVQTKEVSDYRQEKESSQGWARYLSNFQDVETLARFAPHGDAVAKYANRKLILNVDESQSKTVIVLLAAKRGSGSLAEGFDTDISSSSSSSSSTSESDSSDSTSSSSEENDQQNNREARQQNQQSSSSSSSSSSETNEASNSNENSQEVLKNGRLIVVAVLTKKVEIPPVSNSGGVIDLLKDENQHQFIVQLSKRSDKFFLRYAQGAAADEAARSLPNTDSNSIEKLANFVINPNYQGQQNEFCSEVSAKINYPDIAHPRLLVALREALLNSELNVDVSALAQYAHTCKNEDLKQNEISMTGQLQRGQNMTEYAASKSQEAQQCQQDENQGFSVSDDCLTVAQQAAALNKARLSFRWTNNLAQRFQQAVYDARDFVKATYQAHVSHNRFPLPQNRAEGNSAIVKLRISPDGEYWSASVASNETYLQIQNVPSNSAIQAAFPLSALQSVGQNIQDSILGDASQPTCQLEGNKISSFDNVVDEINTSVAEDCYHLLTADGSGQDNMAVMAKNLGTDNVKLQLILSQNTIQLSSQRSVPRARLSQIEQANDIVATINGQSVALPYTIRKQGQRGQSNDYVARIQPHPSGGVQVLTPKNDIAFDGSKIIIFIAETYRNKTVGLCGDFNGEQVADRRSRKDIPLSSATLLYANYAYDAEGNQCQVNEQTKQQIKQEEAIAKINRNGKIQNGHQNLQWGQTWSWTQSQQNNVWQNSPYNNQESDSTSQENQKNQHSSHFGQNQNRQNNQNRYNRH